jgi:hypothetical protein
MNEATNYTRAHIWNFTTSLLNERPISDIHFLRRKMENLRKRLGAA